MITKTNTPKEALKTFFGFDSFKGRQELIVKNVLEGNHTFVIMPTGGGKSLCYQLPALMSEGCAIVVSPLIALMKNQVDSIRGFSESESVAHVLNSSLNKTETARVLSDIRAGHTKLLFVAPESLIKQDYIDFLRETKIAFFAIDEAHCISEWGHDFRPEYRRLRTIIEKIGNVPIIALTATATPKVSQDIQKTLGMGDAVQFKDSFNRENLFYEVRPKQNAMKQIIRFIKDRPNKSGIIYCLSRKKVEEIAQTLQINGIKALPYHAGLEAQLRAKTQDDFLMEEVDVIVATIAFGMGIDKPDVRYVIHHDIPKSLEGYYQETGRAGRDGGEGHCLAFYSYKDIEKLEKFLHNKQVAEKEVGKQLLQEMVSYAETSVCRRKYILHYFGEVFDEAKCNKKCDNCKNPRERIDGTQDVVLLLKAIESLNENFKAPYIVSLLLGDSSTEIQKYKGDKNEFFGKGTHRDEKYWNAAIRQSILKRLLIKEIESYGVIKISEKGHQFMVKPEKVEILKEHDYSDLETDIETNSNTGAAVDENLMKMLKDLRRKVAKEKGVPPFVIFQDPSLEEMASQYPISKDDMLNIGGVGEGKVKKYGKPFMQLIERYVEENEIERPDEFVMRNVANPSGKKVQLVLKIDQKIPFEDIAKSRNQTLDQLLDEIEGIVFAGTKLNIDYYLEEELDEDIIEEIYDYFLEAESDDLDEAYEEFEGDYTEEEIRLVRIKFMSEMAH
ncbi:DNA helicase RecQ [Luteibaculum oceani]|uniref:DNA helicase RecQ n=1 Tax=Luteibaculum oceani TaxID=1294296 RepID=A0A5C6VAD8_9FLAO|nr:DNA helicase RecQ [Luteibaculum oceani]TXC81784.1 DNA helicase RecQ [Luteibaculum oceani]